MCRHRREQRGRTISYGGTNVDSDDNEDNIDDDDNDNDNGNSNDISHNGLVGFRNRAYICGI